MYIQSYVIYMYVIVKMMLSYKAHYFSRSKLRMHSYYTLKLLHHNILLGVQQSIQYPISTPVTTNTQSLLSSDQQHHTMSPSE